MLERKSPETILHISMPESEHNFKLPESQAHGEMLKAHTR